MVTIRNQVKPNQHKLKQLTPYQLELNPPKFNQLKLHLLSLKVQALSRLKGKSPRRLNKTTNWIFQKNGSQSTRLDYSAYYAKINI
jgi:hypothetical protein